MQNIGSQHIEPAPSPHISTAGVWMPSQFKDDSELSPYARKKRLSRRARMRDDYAGRPFTLGEIIANSVSTGVAAMLAIAALVILVVAAVRHGGGINLAAALIFAIPLIVSNVMSTLYYALQSPTAKRVFKVLDNSSTYLLIAGAFTPYCLLTIGGSAGMGLLVAEWVIAAAGIVIEALWATRPRWLHGVLYVVMCVVFISFAGVLYDALPAPGFWLLVAALCCLAVAMLFRWFSSVHYLSFVFRIVATAGMICLFLSVVLFVI